jgi:hypothetical protein
MDAQQTALQEEKLQLLRRLAEIEVEQQRQQGTFQGVPHYSVLEQAAHALGQDLSRLTQQRAACEVAAANPATAACPQCGQSHAVEMAKRTVHSLDGPVEVLEPRAYCPACRRAFFPST